MADTEPDGGVLARWSERKQAARRGASLPAEPPLVDPVPSTDGQSVAQPVRGPGHPPAAARILTDTDMPPLDTLDEHSDYSGFLSRGVSAALRRQALSRLFHSPHLDLASSLDDFPEDYTRFEDLGGLITADMRHQAEMQARRFAERASPQSELPSAATDARAGPPESAAAGRESTAPPQQPLWDDPAACAGPEGPVADPPRRRGRA